MHRLMKSESIRRDIENILSTAVGEKIDICYLIYNKIIQCKDDEPELLCYFFENSEQIEADGSNRIENIITIDEKYQYTARYGKIVDDILEYLLNQNFPKEEFYKKLWDFISKNTYLDNTKKQVFALYYIWIDVRIPYFELSPGIKMSSDKYRRLRKKILKEIQQARFILSVPVEQKTERSSRLVSLLNSLESEEEKAVLMAQILLLWEQKNAK